MENKLEIPEWFETWIADWLREHVVTQQSPDEDIDITLDRHNAKTTWARSIAYAAYRHLSQQRGEGGCRWVKVTEIVPDEDISIAIRESKDHRIYAAYYYPDSHVFMCPESPSLIFQKNEVEWLYEPTSPIEGSIKM
jgi:hypothetical protein